MRNVKIDQSFSEGARTMTSSLGLMPFKGGNSCSIYIDNKQYTVLNMCHQHLEHIKSSMGNNSLSFYLFEDDNRCLCFQSEESKNRYGPIPRSWYFESVTTFGSDFISQKSLNKDSRKEYLDIYKKIIDFKDGYAKLKS